MFLPLFDDNGALRKRRDGSRTASYTWVMNKSKQSLQALPQRLQKACHQLQQLEQQLSLLGYQSDTITAKMQRIRQRINPLLKSKTHAPKDSQK